MSVIEAIILGIVQGLTEFLPVSSSGHLALAGAIFGVQDAPVFFDALLHVGTLIAVFIAFRKLIWRLIKAFFEMLADIFTGKFKWKTSSPDQKMIVFLIISLLPLFLILPVRKTIENLSSYIWIVGIALIINSAVLFLSDRIRSGHKKAENQTWKDALIVGLVQAVAVTPGISRSGSTITAGVFCGFSRKYAAQYSFILSIPTILAGAAVSFLDAVEANAVSTADIFPYLAGMIAAAIVGFFAIKLLEYLLKSRKFFIFAIYTFVVGVVAVVAGIIQ